MEDTKSLLMMVLHKIFQNQPKTVENTFQLIHSYNNGKIDKTQYEKTLKTICDLMNDELPSPILVYVLTLVDMPQEFDSQSPLIEKMRQTHSILPEINVRPHLLEYLNNIRPTTSRHKAPNDTLKKIATGKDIVLNEIKKVEVTFAKPAKVTRRSRKLLPKFETNPKSLLDVCSCYVVSNETMLKEMYKKKKTKAWQLINNNIFKDKQLEQCYNVLKDLNKKMKWLREIESDNISSEILMDEYKNSDIFFRENHCFHELFSDPFELPEECNKVINKMFEM